MSRIAMIGHAVLAGLLMLAMPCSDAGAQQPTGTGLRASSQVLTLDYRSARTLAAPAQPPLPELGASTAAARYAAGSVVDLNPYVQVEMPRDLGDGSYSRPKVRLGLQSEPLKSLATSFGLQAERCTLQTLRARSSASSDELSASLMLFARCSFY